MNLVKIQKTFLGKTAGQWLSEAQVRESRAGCYEIFVGHDVIARYHPKGLLLENSEGPLVVLDLKKIQNERFCNLCELLDSYCDHDRPD